MTIASLKSFSHKDLALMAKQGGVRGWHSMRKDQLVKALITAARAKALKPRIAAKQPVPMLRSGTAKAARPRAATSVPQSVSRPNISRTSAARPVATRPAEMRTVVRRAPLPRPTVARPAVVHAPPPRASVARPAVPARKPTSPRVLKHLKRVKDKITRCKNIASPNGKPNGQLRDRIVVMVRDAFWLHVYWELTRHSVERAEAAMGQQWHSAHPCLRLLEVSEGGATSASERVVEDIEIHGGLSNWYVHVSGAPKCYRLEIGYLAEGGRFFSLSRSNVVTTPAPGTSDSVDEHWAGVAEDFDKIYAMSGGYSPEGASAELQELFEERLRRPMGSPMVTRYGVGVEGLFLGRNEFKLDVDAELIVFGATDPNAHVSLRGEPVKLRPDGSFTMRMSLPNQRQVIPVVACAANGTEQRTIVLAIERNTKVMEPVLRESND